MATETVSDRGSTSRVSAVTSLNSYKSATDNEVREYSRSLHEYERSLEQIARKASRPARLPFMKAGESRTSDTRTVNKLLREWENDRTMATVVGNGDRPARQRQQVPARDSVLTNPGFAIRQEIPADARPQPKIYLEERPGAMDHVVEFLAQARQVPAILAAIFTIATVMSAWFVPATVVTGLMASQTLSLPQISDADQALFDYSTPISEDMLTVDTSQVDTRKFDMLTLRDYVVQPGETLSHIAARFNLHIDTIISFNNITNPRSISAGTRYKIPNRDGLLHQISANDTLDSVSKKYGVSVVSLLDGNNMDDVALKVGGSLFIPEARMNQMDLKMLLGELFVWPVIARFSGGYGYRTDPFTGVRMFHNGIDLAGYVGAPVRAGMEGRVVDIQSQIGNYGKMIIIQHPRGFKTLYGHLSAFNVEVGQYVSQGQLIARMGNTGRSTGPHLHFSVIKNGSFVNPLRYLK